MKINKNREQLKRNHISAKAILKKMSLESSFKTVNTWSIYNQVWQLIPKHWSSCSKRSITILAVCSWLLKSIASG